MGGNWNVSAFNQMDGSDQYLIRIRVAVIIKVQL